MTPDPVSLSPAERGLVEDLRSALDKAVGQLSDEDVAKLAGRSRQVEKDFAAGSLSDRDLLVIVIIAVLIIALIAALH